MMRINNKLLRRTRIELRVTLRRIIKRNNFHPNDVSNLDPVGYAGAIAMLILVLAVAVLLPARRALRLDVAKALHCE